VITDGIISFLQFLIVSSKDRNRMEDLKSNMEKKEKTNSNPNPNFMFVSKGMIISGKVAVKMFSISSVLLLPKGQISPFN